VIKMNYTGGGFFGGERDVGNEKNYSQKEIGFHMGGFNAER